MPQAINQNALFYGDNLDILREYVADNSVDLVYLDPPFNSARNYNVLFRDWWALSLVKARPLGGDGGKTGKKGSDRGIDGIINFVDDNSGKPKRVLVQVKSGHVRSGDIRDLRGTVEREDAAIGVFVTLEEPTREMTREAVVAGQYHSPGWQQEYPRIQILTIEQLLHGAQIKMPPPHGTFRQAQRVRVPDAEQVQFDLGAS